WHQAMTDRDTLVKNEAVALPTALFRGHCLKVLENAALQMIDLVEALGLQIGRGLFAAYTARTKHGNAALAIQGTARCGLLLHPLGKIRECRSVGIDRVVKCANADFVVVTHVDHSDVRVGYQRIPLIR